MASRPSDSNLKTPWYWTRLRAPVLSGVNWVRTKSIVGGLARGSITNASAASAFASPPVVSVIPAKVQCSSTPIAGAAGRPRRARPRSRPIGPGMVRTRREGGPASVRLSPPARGASFATSLVGSRPWRRPAGPVTWPANWNPATAPRTTTAVPARAPALSFDANMAVSTPSANDDGGDGRGTDAGGRRRRGRGEGFRDDGRAPRPSRWRGGTRRGPVSVAKDRGPARGGWTGFPR